MIEIVNYQETWPSDFQQIASRLRQALGDMALRIDHIGSTAVPDLPAKDVIDIQITVGSLDEAIIAALTSLGYVQPDGVWRDHPIPHFVGPVTEWEKLFFQPPPGQRRTNTHVRIQGRANQRYALLFRDYLRAHPDSAAAYGELKRRLAAHLADPQTYPQVKDPAVDIIYFAAEAWSAAEHWQPGSSDA